MTLSYKPPDGWLFPTVEEIALQEKGAIRIGPFGSALKKHEYSEAGVRVLGIEDVLPNQLISERRKFIPEAKYRELSQYTVAAGDILVTNMGTVGRACVVPDDLERSIISSHPIKVTFDLEIVWPSYISWILNFCPLVVAQVKAKCHGAIMAGFNSGLLKQLRIPLPPLADQQRISEVLDRAEALRAKRRAALAQLDSLPQALFLDLFGDPVSNPKGVKVVRLADVATRITDGVHQKPDYTESGVPFISVKDITTGRLIFDDCKFISFDDHERFTRRCKPERLDILYTKVGATYGRPAIVETGREFSIYVSVCLIKPRKDLIDPHFLTAALGTSAVKNQADRRIKGIGVPDLHLDQIQSFLIPLPSMAEQREFARRVGVVEKLKTAQAASLAELDALFASLQHRAFRGELFRESTRAELAEHV